MAREVVEFIKAAVRNPLAVSTVFPTSAPLAEAMLDRGRIDSAASVVELGAGTGAITKHVRKRASATSSYLGIELDTKMVQYLRCEFPGLRFESGLAENLGNWAPEGTVDLIISSLPWTMFSTETQTRTIDAILAALRPGGMFLTYICLHAIFYPQARSFVSMLKNGFSEVVRAPLEWRNLPPAFIFQAIK